MCATRYVYIKRRPKRCLGGLWVPNMRDPRTRIGIFRYALCPMLYDVKPHQAKASHVMPCQIMPGQARPGQAMRYDAKPCQAKPCHASHAMPRQAKPCHAKPRHTKPS